MSVLGHVRTIRRPLLQVHTDNDICTTYFWKRPHMLSSESTATITWTIPEGTPDGTYTIWHYGDYKHIAAGVQSFKGKSGNTWSQPSSFKSNAAVTSGKARSHQAACSDVPNGALHFLADVGCRCGVGPAGTFTVGASRQHLCWLATKLRTLWSLMTLPTWANY